MTNEIKLVQKFASTGTSQLKDLRQYLVWIRDESILNTTEVIKYVDRVLRMRGESVEKEGEKKILLLCSCRYAIVKPLNAEAGEENMEIYKLLMEPCPKCRRVGQYSWKYTT